MFSFSEIRISMKADFPFLPTSQAAVFMIIDYEVLLSLDGSERTSWTNGIHWTPWTPGMLPVIWTLTCSYQDFIVIIYKFLKCKTRFLVSLSGVKWCIVLVIMVMIIVSVSGKSWKSWSEGGERRPRSSGKNTSWSQHELWTQQNQIFEHFLCN